MLKSIFLKLSQTFFRFINPPVWIRDFIMWPLASRILGQNFNRIITLRNGLKLYTDLKDILGRLVIFYGPSRKYFWEPQTTKLIEKIVEDKREVLVAGSHIGLMALETRKAMKNKDARVHTFEPVNYLYNLLNKNIHLNNYDKSVLSYKKALSNKAGKVEISVDTLRSTTKNKDPNAEVEIVETVTLDNLYTKGVINQVDFMLLDVEGAEIDVLHGAEKLISESNSLEIIFEVILKERSSLRKITNFLSSFGYFYYVIEDDYKYLLKDIGEVKLTEISKLEKKSYNKSEYVNILATRTECGNLVGGHVSITPEDKDTSD